MQELWAHQKDAVAKARLRDSFALFMEMGTGKTRTQIEILREHYGSVKRLSSTLIFCPPVVITNWKREFNTYSKIPSSRIVCLVGSAKKRVKDLTEFLAQGHGQGIAITNYEALLMPELYAALNAWGPEILILDESHRVKNHSAKRTKAAIQLADKAKRRFLLSGTPVLNSPMDLFAQYRIMDRGWSMGKNFFAFRARYFYDKNAGMPRDRHFPNWQIRPGALDELTGILNRTSVRVKKEECLDLPPLVRQDIPVEMLPEQARHYEEMKNDFVTYIQSQACVASLAITKALRLQQIVSGFARVDEPEGSRDQPKNVSFGETPRERALCDLLEEICPHHKVIVWAVFRENYAAIRQACTSLGIKFVEVHGDVPGTQKSAAVEEFSSDPATRVLIGHPGSGGIGINLVAASYMIYFSRNFSLEQYLQSQARNHRGGSEIHEKITEIHLYTPGTIDELVMKRLAQKEEMGEALLRDLSQKL